MNKSARVVAFLDVSVLYPALLRNLPMHLALRDLFRTLVGSRPRGTGRGAVCATGLTWRSRSWREHAG
jgi:hypothetical protein